MFTISPQLVEQSRAQHQALLEAAQRAQLVASLAPSSNRPKFGYRLGEWLVRLGEWLKAQHHCPTTSHPSAMVR